MGQPTGVWIVSAAELEGILSSLQDNGGTADHIRLMKDPVIAGRVVMLLETELVLRGRKNE